MWTRSLLKTNAKAVLSHSYWRTFVACLLVGLASSSTLTALQYTRIQINLNTGFLSYRTATVLLMFLIAGSLFSLALNIFVGMPLQVGCCRLLMENRVGNPPFSTLTSVFGSGYGNVLKSMLLYSLIVVLWGGVPMTILLALGIILNSYILILLSMLCVIPMIYKSLQLVLVPYLLAENPYMNSRRARQLSAAMTQGEKGRIFVLGLSFLGWSLLGVLLCGIGALFVSPYIQATYAELYAALRAKAFSQGLTSEEELGGFVRY